jgi:uncharacterized protein YjbI with pentapeptide repeats
MSAATGVQHENENLANSVFKDLDLSGSHFEDVSLRNALFENSAFTGATLRNVCLAGVTIEDANFECIRIDGVLVGDLFKAYKQTKAR